MTKNLADIFKAIAYGAGRGVASAVTGLVGANLLANDSYKVAAFLLGTAQESLSTTATAIKDWLGTSSLLPSFKAIAYGAGRGAADGIRGLVGAGLLANNRSSIYGFLISQFNFSTTVNVLRKVGF